MRTIKEVVVEYQKYENLIPYYFSYAKNIMNSNIKDAFDVFCSAKRISRDMLEDAVLLGDQAKIEKAEGYVKESKEWISKCEMKIEKTK